MCLYLRACGWYVLDVFDGDYNVSAICAAISHAKNHRGSPTFINVRTTIGLQTSIAGTSKAHHTAFGSENVKNCKKAWSLDEEKSHYIPDDVREYWAEIRSRGTRLHDQWEESLEQYVAENPERSGELLRKTKGTVPVEWINTLENMQAPTNEIPTRQASGQVYDHLWNMLPLIAGSADLSEPNFMLKAAKSIFGAPESEKSSTADKNDISRFAGRYIHYGVREHGMMSIANGIAAYARRAFIPVTATFAMFQLYGAAGIRMSALAKLQVIHIGTHDSIAEGACGPTHQVSELTTHRIHFLREFFC